MSAPARFAYGKRAPKNAPALLFAHYRTGAALAFPPVDYLTTLDWSATMNGNDAAGDCVACGFSNLILLFSTIFAGTGIRATLDEVIAFYKTQNPGFVYGNGPHGFGSADDAGMDEQTACETLVKTGISIGGKVYKARAFCKVDHTNLAELRAAISLTGGLLLGVQVAQAQQNQFPGTWDYVPGSPIEGGHCIIAGGHGDLPADELDTECWAAPFRITDAFMTHQLDEAWLLLFDWHLASKQLIAGMDMATFAADLHQITNGAITINVPTPPGPSPVPPPPPSPAPDADQVLAQAVHDWVNNHKHSGEAADVARALKTWLTAKGLS